jgi:O-antigen/teichoic acid export membrane protein
MRLFSQIHDWLLNNKTTEQKIAKNTFWLFFGQIFGRLTRVAIIIYAARVLGPASWGAFSYAMGLVAFMTIFSDIGVSAIVTRESSKDPARSQAYFSTALAMKLVLLVIGTLILVFGAPYITNIEEAKALMPLIALVLIFDSLRNFGFAINRSEEKMEREGINEVVTNVAITIFGFVALLRSTSSFALTAAYAAATGFGFFLIAWQLKSYFRGLLAHFDMKLIKPILEMAWPFALASSLGAIMINTDTIMIGWLRSAEEVGFYSAALRPVQLLYVLPTLFAASLFPTFTKLARQNDAEFTRILETALTVSLLIALPIAFGGIIIGDQFINLLFGSEYQNAILPFQILILTTLIVFPSAIISNAIFSYNEQKKFVTFSSLGAGGNIVFNFLLIPYFGIAGCAVSTIFTQLIANGFIWKKMKEVNRFSIFGKIKKAALATLLMALTLFLLKEFGAPLLFNLSFAALTYFATLKIFKEELLENLLK